jgi:hypothetical protein
MTPSQYAAVSVGIAIGFASVSTVVYRVVGRRGLWLTWFLSTGVLGVLVYLDWVRTPGNETPPSAYFLVPTVPTLAAAAFIQSAVRQRYPLAVQLIGAAAICWVLMPVMILVSMLLV